MGYKQMIEKIESCSGIGFNKRVILRDIKFMLTELKQSRKFGLLSYRDRKDLMGLIDGIGCGNYFMKNWEYGAYFRLKELYLNFKEGAD